MSLTSPSAAMRRNAPSSPPETKPPGRRPAARHSIAPSCTGPGARPRWVRQPHNLHRAVAQREGDRGAVAREARGDDERVEIAGDAACVNQELGVHGLAHGDPI